MEKESVNQQWLEYQDCLGVSQQPFGLSTLKWGMYVESDIQFAVAFQDVIRAKKDSESKISMEPMLVINQQFLVDYNDKKVMASRLGIEIVPETEADEDYNGQSFSKY